jgi:C4-dicarboxylate-binding protein DctP
MARTWWLAAALIAVLSLAGGAIAQPAQPIVIKFSHVVAPDSPKGKAALRFKALAEERTGGRVRVEVYPNSQLYKDKDEMEALQLGAVQMLAPSLAKLGQLGFREFELFDLPFIFPSRDVLRAVTEGPIGKGLLARLEPRGIAGLAYWDNGFKIMSANRPLRLPADFAGLKMRIQPSKVLDLQMRALGAYPQVMAFSEVYQALKSGVADGTENPPSNMATQHMDEVQRHATLSNHGYLGYAVLVNKKFWDELPRDLRRGLEQAMAEATTYANAIAAQENADAVRAMRARGHTAFHELSPDEAAAWRKALTPVHAQMEARLGHDLIAAINREAARLGN